MTTPITLKVNGRTVSDAVEPRMHLADFVRDKLGLTGTHLRCEQGVCGVCTVLIDGHPARSCLTYVALCDGAEVMTIEGLEQDSVTGSLREAFSAEHGLQCGYCTPGMLISARDIVMRLPDADELRVRKELSGNLCRCTGYAGIVRAVCRVLETRRTEEVRSPVPGHPGIGPVGSRRRDPDDAPALGSAAPHQRENDPALDGPRSNLGLGSREPNIKIRQSLIVRHPVEDVWLALGDVERIATCLPGARLLRPPEGGELEGEVAVKLGPITARFRGHGRLVRDESQLHGTIYGAGQDRRSRSQTAAELDYGLTPLENGTATRLDISVRALLSGPLAQFGRSGIVDELAARITRDFAAKFEQQLAGAPPAGGSDVASRSSLSATSLLWAVIAAQLKSVAAWFGKRSGNERKR